MATSKRAPGCFCDSMTKQGMAPGQEFDHSIQASGGLTLNASADMLPSVGEPSDSNSEALIHIQHFS